jgi:HSP20 family protein
MLIKGLGPAAEKITLRNAVDRLLADGLRTPEEWLERVTAATNPPLSLYETEGALVVKAHLLGVAPEELYIDVRENVLTLAGETREDAQREEGDQMLVEQVYGAFERTVTLPCPVQADQGVAEFTDEILTVTLPKAAKVAQEPPVSADPAGSPSVLSPGRGVARCSSECHAWPDRRAPWNETAHCQF